MFTKRFICWTLLLWAMPMFFVPKSSAKVYFQDTLIIEDGVGELTLQCGEKKQLSVADGFWEYPIIEGVSYYSTAPFVAWVDGRGIVHAMLPGRAIILVVDEDDRNSSIEIIVEGEGKIPWKIGRWIALPILLFLICFCYKKIRGFN